MSIAEAPATQLLTVPEVADRLHVSRATVYRKIAAGELPALRISAHGDSGPVRVDAVELEEWLYGEAA